MFQCGSGCWDVVVRLDHLAITVCLVPERCFGVGDYGCRPTDMGFPLVTSLVCQLYHILEQHCVARPVVIERALCFRFSGDVASRSLWLLPDDFDGGGGWGLGFG